MSEATGPAVPGESGNRGEEALVVLLSPNGLRAGGFPSFFSCTHSPPYQDHLLGNIKSEYQTQFMSVSRSDVVRGEFLVPVMRNQIVIESENKCFNR